MSVAHCNKGCLLVDQCGVCTYVYECDVCELVCVCVCVCVCTGSFDDCKLNVGSEWPLMSLIQRSVKLLK